MEILEGGWGRFVIGGALGAVGTYFLPKKYKLKPVTAFIVGGSINYLLPHVAPQLGLSGWGPMEGMGDHATTPFGLKPMVGSDFAHRLDGI